MLTASTVQGEVRGFERSGIRVWRGVPYSQPPVGALRWKAPQAPLPWTGIRDATEFGNRSIQPQPWIPFQDGHGIENDRSQQISEDCLFLNISSPTAISPGGSPVLVWFHGGGFLYGSGADPIGDGQALVEQGVTVVTVNYRLGAIGNLYLADLFGDDYEGSGNCSLLDQIAALRWVRDNISGFGGDPDRVTIAGNSAGAKSVVNLMAAPQAAGLFRGVICESGGDHVISIGEAVELRDRFFDILGQQPRTIDALQAVSSDKLLTAQTEMASGVSSTWVWRATYGDSTLPVKPTHAIREGTARGVHLMAGTAKDESFYYDQYDPNGASWARQVIGEIFGARADEVVATYASSVDGNNSREVDRAIMTDERYAAPTLLVLDAHSVHSPCWRYQIIDLDGTHGPVPHSSDLPLVWGVGLENVGPATKQLAQTLRDTWVTFIFGPRPVGANLPHWKSYTTANPRTMRIGVCSRLDETLEPTEELWREASWDPGTWWPLGTHIAANV